VGVEESIEQLGAELVQCTDGCAGIWLDRSRGIVLRTLFLERAAAPGRGSVAVGLNPGTSKESERSYYREGAASYARLKEYSLKLANIPYFARTRSIIDQLGLIGPILWSNLAKCENESGRKGLPPLQTLRHCTRRFLQRELSAVPANWAVLGLGWEAYRALAYILPDRPVVGIPHPTGGFRDFRKMLLDGVRLRPDILVRAGSVLRSDEPSTVWLGSSGAAGSIPSETQAGR